MRLEYVTVVRKFNPYHDELGKFTTSDGSSAPLLDESFVDGLKYINKEDKEFCKYFLNMMKEEKLKNTDTRLGMDEEQAYSRVCEQVQSEMEKIGRKKNKHYILADLTKKAVNDALNEAETKYCHEKLGKDIEVEAPYAVDHKVLDFIDGASWVKKNIGDATELTAIFSDPGHKERYGWGLNSRNAMAGVTHEGDGKCRMILSEGEFCYEGDSIGKGEPDRFHPKGLSFGQIGAHEYTHALEYTLTNKLVDKYFGGDQKAKSFANSLNPVSDVIVTKALEKCGETGVEFISDAKLVKEVSGYATSGHTETMAECVGDYYSNGENAETLSKAVVELLKSEDVVDIVAEEVLKLRGYQSYIPK